MLGEDVAGKTDSIRGFLRSEGSGSANPTSRPRIDPLRRSEVLHKEKPRNAIPNKLDSLNWQNQEIRVTVKRLYNNSDQLDKLSTHVKSHDHVLALGRMRTSGSISLAMEYGVNLSLGFGNSKSVASMLVDVPTPKCDW